MSIFKKLSAKHRKKIKYEKEFKEANPKSILLPKDKIPLSQIKCGKYSYGNPKILIFGAKEEKIEIGNYVSIAENVSFLLSGGHFVDTFTTFPFKAICFSKENETLCKGPIKVGDDVWIGYGATILSGCNYWAGSSNCSRKCYSKRCRAIFCCWRKSCQIIKISIFKRNN